MSKTNRRALSVPVGHIFSGWKVIGHPGKFDYLTCQCECGTVRDVNVYSLISGKSVSCGCQGPRRRATLYLEKSNGRSNVQLDNNVSDMPGADSN